MKQEVRVNTRLRDRFNFSLLLLLLRIHLGYYKPRVLNRREFHAVKNFPRKIAPPPIIFPFEIPLPRLLPH